MKYAMALEDSKASVLKNSLIVLILFILLAPELALASVGGGGALPYETWLVTNLFGGAVISSSGEVLQLTPESTDELITPESNTNEGRG